MIYRVILKVGYNEAWFDFDTIEEAGEFAKTILVHQTENEDSKRRSVIRLEVIDTTIVDGEEEE